MNYKSHAEIYADKSLIDDEPVYRETLELEVDEDIIWMAIKEKEFEHGADFRTVLELRAKTAPEILDALMALDSLERLTQEAKDFLKKRLTTLEK